MIQTRTKIFALWALSGLGLLGAARLSLATYAQLSPCPKVAGIYVCYAVLVSYATMLTALVLKGKVDKLWFYTAWGVVFSIALFATVLELLFRGTCPAGVYGLPACYASLLISGLVGWLYWHIDKPKAKAWRH